VTPLSLAEFTREGCVTVGFRPAVPRCASLAFRHDKWQGKKALLVSLHTQHRHTHGRLRWRTIRNGWRRWQRQEPDHRHSAQRNRAECRKWPPYAEHRNRHFEGDRMSLRNLCSSVFSEEPGSASNCASYHRIFPALRACAHEHRWNPIVLVLWDGNSLRDDALAIQFNRNRSSHARYIQRRDCPRHASRLVRFDRVSNLFYTFITDFQQPCQRGR
jgi:hypothetical protein